MASEIKPPYGMRVLWQLPLPTIGPYHSYSSFSDPQDVHRLQQALRRRGLPPVRMLPQYKVQDEQGNPVFALCFCHQNREQYEAFEAVLTEEALPMPFLPVSKLAHFFRVPIDAKTLFPDLYHWDPWMHRWRLEQVNDILLRFGLPRRARLELGNGRRILCILAVWEDPDRPHEVAVRYAVEEVGGHEAFATTVRYERSHDVQLCVAVDGKIAVLIYSDDIQERESWCFPTIRLDRKPTNVGLRDAIAPSLSVARLSVSSLGERWDQRRRVVCKLVRLPSKSDETFASLSAHGTDVSWKSWSEILGALEGGILDNAAEIMVMRLLRCFTDTDNLFRAEERCGA